jgi:hypothetical protein
MKHLIITFCALLSISTFAKQNILLLNQYHKMNIEQVDKIKASLTKGNQVIASNFRSSCINMNYILSNSNNLEFFQNIRYDINGSSGKKSSILAISLYGSLGDNPSGHGEWVKIDYNNKSNKLLRAVHGDYEWGKIYDAQLNSVSFLRMIKTSFKCNFQDNN